MKKKRFSMRDLLAVCIVALALPGVAFSQDTDSDGVSDAVDVDDDNDGILDTDEGFAAPNFVANSALTGPTGTAVQPPSWTAALGSNPGGGVVSTADTLDINFPTYAADLGNVPLVTASASPDGGSWVGLVAAEGSTGSAHYNESIQQTVSGLSIGNTYTVSFYVANFGVKDALVRPGGAQAYVDGTLVADSGIFAPTASTWSLITGTFVASSTSITLEIDAYYNTLNLGSYDGAYMSVDGVTLTGESCIDSDSDSICNHLDLDSDNDGIPDNVEAQATDGYVVPAGVVDAQGLDTAYSGGLSPVNTDGADDVDYLDLDSDNDGFFDIAENGLGLIDGDLDGRTDGVVGVNGLDNTAESADSFADVSGDTYDDGGGVFTLSDTDSDTAASGAGAIPMTADFDYRDVPGVDFGDAPDTGAGTGIGNYETLSANSGPSHVVISGLQIGTAPDADTDGFADGTDTNGDASDDDTEGTADEGAISFAALSTADTSYSIASIAITNTTGGDATLFGWIDLDRNGSFDEDERASTTVADGATSANLNWGSLPGISAGTTYARFRIAAAADLTAGSDGGTDEASLGAANSGEVEDYRVTVLAASISGRIFEDINYGGGAGRTYASADASAQSSGFAADAIAVESITGIVELYDSGGAFVTAADTDTNGQYSFPGLSDGVYYIRVVNDLVESQRSGGNGAEAGVQTFRSDGTTDVVNEIGGRNPAEADAGAAASGAVLNTTTFEFATGAGSALTGQQAQSVTAITISGASVGDVDFGFNFDTVVNTNDAGQGSLRQFIDNANRLGNTGLDQALPAAVTGYVTGDEVSIFMIPTASVAEISITSTELPTITDANTRIDGRTQTANIGDTNGTSFGTTTTVGVDGIDLLPLAGPEVLISHNGGSLNNGLVLLADNLTVRNVAMHGFQRSDIVIGAGATTDIRENVLGMHASSIADPGGISRSHRAILIDGDGSSSTISGNVIDHTVSNAVSSLPGYSNWALTVVQNQIVHRGYAGQINEHGTVNLFAASNVTVVMENNELVGPTTPAAQNSGVAALQIVSGSGSTVTATNNTFTGGIGGFEARAENGDITATIERNIASLGLTAGFASTLATPSAVINSNVRDNQISLTDQGILTNFDDGGTASLDISGNIISDVTGIGILVSGNASTGAVSGSIVNNTITDSGQAGIVSSDDVAAAVNGSILVQGNTVSGSGLVGLGNNSATVTSYLQNTVFSSGGLGIDLQFDGVTANDSGDSDAGPNSLLNFPVISSIGADGTVNLDYDFYLDVPANAEGYLVEIYRDNVSGDSHGEGAEYLGALTVPHAGGNLNFSGSFVSSLTIDGGDVITMTATRIDSGNTSGFAETSEFSSVVSAGVPGDFGDAPDTGAGTGTGNYETLLANGGPSHAIIAGLAIGTAPDTDTDGFADGTDTNGDASDDDTEGTADEGAIVFSALGTTDTSYSLNGIAVTNTTGGDATLFGWIDLDRDGSFDEDERASTTVADGATSANLNWGSLPGISAGTTYARFRIAAAADLTAGSDGGADEASLGAANSGEVEDYTLSIAAPPQAGPMVDTDGDGIDDPNDLDDDNDGILDYDESSCTVTNTALPDLLSLYTNGTTLLPNGVTVVTSVFGVGTSTPVATPVAPDLLLIEDTNNEFTDPTNTFYDYAVLKLDFSDAVMVNGTFDLYDIDYSQRVAAFGGFDGNLIPAEMLAINNTSVQTGDLGNQPAGIAASGSFPILKANPTGSTWTLDGQAVFNKTVDSVFFLFNTSDQNTALSGVRVGYSGTVTLCQLDEDTDSDGVANHLDLDSDNDGISDITESGADAATLDPESNGVIDNAQFADADADGLSDAIEAINGNDVGTAVVDTDADTTPDYHDLDSDDDGIPDAVEAQATPDFALNYSNDGNVADDDADGDGIIDIYDDFSGHGGSFNTPQNTDAADQPDYIDTDADNDSALDSAEGGSLVTGVSYADPNGNIDDPASDLPNELGDTTEVAYRETGDFGDAPDTGAGTGTGNYETLLANGGPSHAIIAGLAIGTAPDTDTDGFADGTDTNGDASDDDTEGTADEGAIVFSALGTTDTSYSLNGIAVTNTTGGDATLFGWIDLDRDGSFDEDERASTTVADGATSANLNWGSLPGISAGTTYARFRIAAAADLTAGSDGGADEASLGAANSGEVEDYEITVIDVGNTISGFVFNDNGNGAGIAHDGIVNGTEAGFAGLTIRVLHDADGNGVCDGSETELGSAVTESNGGYLVTLEPATFGLDVCLLSETPPAYLSVSESSNGNFINGAPLDDDVMTFTLPGTAINWSAINFGDIAVPTLVPDHIRQAAPGSVVWLPHTYTASSSGTVDFTVADASSNPALSGWEQSLYADADCNGAIDAGEAPLAAAIAVDADNNRQVCLLVRVFVPSTAPAQAQYRLHIDAATSFAGTAISSTSQVTDLVVVGEVGLELRKTVRNVSGAGAETTSNTGHPGDVLEYVVYYRNVGTAPITDLILYDQTPAFSELAGAVGCPGSLPSALTGCSVVEPSAGNVPGYEGAVQWSFTGQLDAGAEGAVSYQVLIQ